MNIATIGSGPIVEHFLDAVQQVEGLQVTHMYTRNKENVENMCKQYDIPNISTNFEELLKEDFDILYIASPNSLHFMQAKQGLRANKHVFCEKPFVTNTKQLQELMKLANEKNRILLEAITIREVPTYKRLKEDLHRVGPLRLAQINFTQFSSRYPLLKEKETPNIFNTAFYGGALADIGIYCIHFIVGLFGQPTHATYLPNLYENGVDTSGIATFTYPTFQVSALIAKDCSGEAHSQIIGEEGYFLIDQQPSLCKSVSLYKKDHIEDISLPQNENVMVYELQRIRQLIEDNDTSLMNELLQNSYTVLELLEKLRPYA